MEKPRLFKKTYQEPQLKNVTYNSKEIIRKINIFGVIFKIFKGIALGLKKVVSIFASLFTKPGLKTLKNTFWHFLSFTLLLIIYLFNAQVVMRLSNTRFFPRKLSGAFAPKWSHFYLKAVSLLDRKTGSISRLDLIELSIRNMQVKKVRSFVTIGGMAIGIGAIVFLVSVGYGLEQLVISRVARLEEMKQADVSLQTGSKIRIDDKTLASFKNIPQIELSLPLIAVVGRVNYQNSVSDMAVYGVTTQYLQQSAIKPVQGKVFDSNELAMEVPSEVPALAEANPPKGQVAGVSTQTAKMGEKIQDIEFTITPNNWVRVRENPDSKSKILGYTKRTEGKYQGEEYWGGSYESDDETGKAGTSESGEPLGKWVKAKVYLWESKKCEVSSQGCAEGKFVVLKENETQIQKEGYFAEINVQLSGMDVVSPQVLGVSTTATTATQSASETLASGWVDIASEAGIIKPLETKTVELGTSAKKQAVVNRAMLKVLGLKETEAVGKKFNASFVVVGDLLADSKQPVESAPSEYTIVGVTPDEKTPLFYVPFVDLRSLGITNYSQVKVVVKDGTSLTKVRRQLEAMGYVTRSVADTVAQINSLFATAKAILALLGMVALAVAALGMFNTLTVSLLERTREVGLMKAMGMRSSEVQELFLTESMIMGFFGGILGIILGFVVGKVLGLILSLFAIFKGVGMIDISYIPFSFVIIVVVLSLLVGILTGIYPARRATKISALNALRYE